MNIRKANISDVPGISLLLDQLGYPTEADNLKSKIFKLLNHPDHLVIVVGQKEVEAVMSIHFVPQIALNGDFAIISYLAVDEKIRSKGIGKKLEEYCVKEAMGRGCEKIQVHCSIKRTDAHRFYERQGYLESRKYYSKSLKETIMVL